MLHLSFLLPSHQHPTAHHFTPIFTPIFTQSIKYLNMARITSAAVATLLCLLQSSPLAFASTPIIDRNGAFTRTTIPESSIGEKGIVAIISSPGTKSFFDIGGDGVTLSPYDGVSILSSPGATLSGTTSLSKGHGAAAASSVAGSIILSGITESDLENGLLDSRHGQTLTGIFRAKIASISASEEGTDDIKPTKLYMVLPPCDVDEELVKSDVQNMFETALVESDSEAIEFDSVFETNIVKVDSEEDAKEIMDLATEGAKDASSTEGDIISSISDAYSSATKASEASSIATTAILACDDSFARQNRAVRAKLSSWKSRTTRGLTVDNFGTSATTLLQRCMESYDRDTLIATGAASSSAAFYRLEKRSRLESKIKLTLEELFKAQIKNLEKMTLSKFNIMLLRQHGKDNVSVEEFYNENAASVRAAAFSFETAMEELEVPSLSLTKTAAVAEISKKLNTALYEFPDSAVAMLKNMKKVSKAVNKKKKPTERRVDLGLDFVAMLRPDGFGNLQGFAGYQLGGNNVIVGVHNDADAPDVISQFGGKRPPFVRVQPKLKVDIEL